jgi:Na+/H+-dicarboxylate symporter
MTSQAFKQAINPAAFFLALKTHLEPMIFAFSGASSSTYMPTAFKMATSLR